MLSFGQQNGQMERRSSKPVEGMLNVPGPKCINCFAVTDLPIYVTLCAAFTALGKCIIRFWILPRGLRQEAKESQRPFLWSSGPLMGSRRFHGR